MKEIYLDIPKPCHEQFSTFKPTPRGGFCTSCQKEVVDFTDWDEERIKQYLLRSPGGCGQFRSSQLKTYVYVQPEAKPSWHWLTACLLAIGTLLTDKTAIAQKRSRPSTEQKVPDAKGEMTAEVPPSQALFISGLVKDQEGNAIPGANVVQKSTINGTVTDAEGRFALALNPTDSKTVVISFIGFETVEYEVSQQQESVEIIMAYDTLQLGGVVVGGYQRKISPRRWWWRLKSLFW